MLTPQGPAQDTTPKPFIFVLMPFDKKFSDIYRFGIKEAAGYRLNKSRQGQRPGGGWDLSR